MFFVLLIVNAREFFWEFKTIWLVKESKSRFASTISVKFIKKTEWVVFCENSGIVMVLGRSLGSCFCKKSLI